MKILLLSHVFAPSVGGIETVSALLAREFVRAGHEVVVLTQTAGPAEASSSAQILRKPGVRALVRRYLWSDVVIQNNISLRTLWPAWLVRRPVLVLYQTWLRADGQGTRGGEFAKCLAARAVRNAFISEALAMAVGQPGPVLGNPYDAEVFTRDASWSRRSGDLLFVGRLVSDKGCDDLLRALALLRARGLQPKLTVVGDGPERSALEALAVQLGLVGQVAFVGTRRGPELADAMRAHGILIVPSRWAEPFGIVAVEGLACGCAVVVSSAGGLREAVGPAGLSFANGDVPGLAQRIEELLREPARRNALLDMAPGHIRRFEPAAYAERLLRYATGGASTS